MPYLAPRVQVTVLADEGHLAETWAGLVEDPERLRRANRQYMVRGVSAGRRAFHPKTLFFRRADGASLLVGSGNLTFGGLLAGQEAFAAYDSGDEEGRAAISVWLEWMSAVLEGLGEERLGARWLEATEDLPREQGTASPFIHNLSEALVPQLERRLPGSSELLMVMAPFHDRDLSALEALREAAKPKAIDLYLCDGAKIDGERLADLVRSSAVPIRLLRPAPGEFVHTKLVGVIVGDRGWLLSGSANCSDVALRLAVPQGNFECGSLVELGAEDVRVAFAGPFEVETWKLEDVASLRWEDEDIHEGDTPLPLVMKSAVHLSDGRVEVRFTGDADDPPWLLSTEGSLAGPLHLAPEWDGVVTGISSVRTPDQTVAVALCDRVGERLSNWVPVDSPRALEGRDRESDREIPDGLAQEDFATEYGRALAWLDSGMNYEVLLGSGQAGPIIELPVAPVTGGPLPPQHRDDLTVPWRPRHMERLQGMTGVPSLDDALLEIDLYRDQLPAIPPMPKIGVIGSEDDEDLSDSDAGEDDNAAERQRAVPLTTAGQRRFANAVDRRCYAAGNRRLYEDDTATAIQYLGRLFSLLEGTLTNPERSEWMSEAQRVRCVGRLLDVLVGRVGKPGLIAVLPADDRTAVVAGLGNEGAIRFGWLVLWCIQPGVEGWKERRFEWKESIAQGVEIGCLDGAGSDADRLLRAATVMDDQHWPDQALDLSGIHVALQRLNKRAHIQLRLSDSSFLFTDPSVPKVLAAWMLYAEQQGDASGANVLLSVPADNRGRISLVDGEAFAKRDGRELPNSVQVDHSTIRALIAEGAPLGKLFGDGASVEQTA